MARKKEMPKSHKEWVMHWQTVKRKENRRKYWLDKIKITKTFFSKLFKIKNI